MKINSLQDLKKVQKQLAEAHEKAQAEAAARAAAARQQLLCGQQQGQAAAHDASASNADVKGCG